MADLTWGVFVPHGATGEFADLTPRQSWARMSEFATAAEELGYDHLWVSDHFMPAGGGRTGQNFEAYTTMAALGGVTKRARLGALVTCALYRQPGMLAKQAANVDATSGGRLIFALGGGWDEGEFAAFGVPFPSPKDRVTAFAETLEAVVRLWSEETVDFEGEYVHLKEAHCNPRPETMPPIWTGTHGKRGLAAAARFADVANWNCDLETFQRLTGVLAEACGQTGRTVETSVFRLADVSPDLGATKRMLADAGAPPEALDVVKQQHFVGQPDEVIPKVQAFVDAGCRHLIILALDAEHAMTTTETFLRDVAPHVRVG